MTTIDPVMQTFLDSKLQNVDAVILLSNVHDVLAENVLTNIYPKNQNYLYLGKLLVSLLEIS